MKKVIRITLLLLGLTFISLHSPAQTSSASGLQWQHSLADAMQEAGTSHKPILMVFSGSDWCKPCIMLRKEVWETEAFVKYAQDNLVLLELDFPRFKKNQLPSEQRKYNEQLASRYNQEGVFPLVVLTDEEGQVLAKTGYEPGGAAHYIEHLQGLLKNK